MADFLKVDAGRLAGAAAAGTGRREADPGSGEVADFDRALNGPAEERGGAGEAAGRDRLSRREEGARQESGRGDANGGEGGQGDDANASPFQLLGGAMDGLLGRGAGMQGADSAAQAQASGASSGASSSGPSSGMDDIQTALVERILVSTPESGGSEVRILLSDGALPGTEIRLARGADGMLVVDLLTDDASSFQTLVAAREALKARLEETEKGGVRVDVTDNARPDDGNAERRSAGYMDYDPEAQRGRRG